MSRRAFLKKRFIRHCGRNERYEVVVCGFEIKKSVKR